MLSNVICPIPRPIQKQVFLAAVRSSVDLHLGGRSLQARPSAVGRALAGENPGWDLGEAKETQKTPIRSNTRNTIGFIVVSSHISGR